MKGAAAFTLEYKDKEFNLKENAFRQYGLQKNG
jgi:hypothetical protein